MAIPAEIYELMDKAYEYIFKCQEIKAGLKLEESEQQNRLGGRTLGLSKAQRVMSLSEAMEKFFDKEGAVNTIVGLLQIDDKDAKPFAQKYVNALYELNPPLEEQVAKLLPEEGARVAIR